MDYSFALIPTVVIVLSVLVALLINTSSKSRIRKHMRVFARRYKANGESLTVQFTREYIKVGALLAAMILVILALATGSYLLFLPAAISFVFSGFFTVSQHVQTIKFTSQTLTITDKSGDTTFETKNIEELTLHWINLYRWGYWAINIKTTTDEKFFTTSILTISESRLRALILFMNYVLDGKLAEVGKLSQADVAKGWEQLKSKADAVSAGGNGLSNTAKWSVLIAVIALVLAGAMLVAWSYIRIRLDPLVQQIDSSSGWVLVDSYKDPADDPVICTAMEPECGVCGYGDNASDYKLVDKKCYVKKS